MQDLLGPLYSLNLPYIEGALRGEPQEFERRIPDPAGGPPRDSLAQYIPDVADGKVRGFCVLVTDVTRLKKAEQALLDMERQAQANERLTSLATMAAGIAHEINNPLAALLAHIELALQALSQDASDLESLRMDLVGARASTLRVRDIVQSMKLLARGDAGRRELVDINDTLQHSIDLALAPFRSRARVERQLEANLFAECNASQLTQVFVNLLTNAAHALPEASSETNEIRVTTRRTGNFVAVEVSDNGVGIPESLQPRVFDAFFTTKSAGAGMGLGLAISNAIVRAFGGSLSLESAVGKGSVFRVTLPAAPSLAVASTPTPRTSGIRIPAATAGAARLRVLIIDDELAVANTLARLLSQQCDVVVKGHGREAIPLLVDDQQRFDLILCDLSMPEPSGEAVYTEVTQKRPELAGRFVFMTGGAFTSEGRRFLESVPVEVLEKPFNLERLRALIAERSRAS